MAMSLVSSKTVRLVAARQGQSQHAAVLHQIYRSYSTPRDPRQAESEAATVRGNRAARARLESHQRAIDEGRHEYEESRTYEGKTLAGEKSSVWVERYIAHLTSSLL